MKGPERYATCLYQKVFYHYDCVTKILTHTKMEPFVSSWPALSSALLTLQVLGIWRAAKLPLPQRLSLALSTVTLGVPRFHL